MKVSHESPMVLLTQSRCYNDFDYALVHLFEEEKYYLEFFKESLRRGREVVLDNSIFELGKAFNKDRYLYWINLLKPTYYIIPDVLNSKEGTLENLKDWMENYAPKVVEGVKTIGVVQGKTYEEAKECYIETDKWVDKIAFSFDCQFYIPSDIDPDLLSDEKKLFLWMEGRKNTILRLLMDGVINKDKEHHLLGTALPQEIYTYHSLPFISSVDTSNPIVHGLKEKKYGENGLQRKEWIKLVDLLHVPHLTPCQMECVEWNLKKFREWANGQTGKETTI